MGQTRFKAAGFIFLNDIGLGGFIEMFVNFGEEGLGFVEIFGRDGFLEFFNTSLKSVLFLQIQNMSFNRLS